MKRYERSLRDEIATAAGGRLDAATVGRFAYALCRTLRETILLDAYGEPVLSDFGISDVMRTATHIPPTSMRGTSNYMAPEAFDPEGGIGPHTDVWAMACVFLEMHTSTVPWEGPCALCMCVCGWFPQEKPERLQE